MTYDPTRELRTNSSDPSRRAVLITPADADLDLYARSLRVVYTGAGTATVRVTYVDEPLDADWVDLVFPAGLTVEASSVRRVWATGTTATDLVIHGYIG